VVRKGSKIIFGFVVFLLACFLMFVNAPIKEGSWLIFASQKSQNLAFRFLREPDEKARKRDGFPKLYVSIDKSYLDQLDTLYDRYEHKVYGVYSDNSKKGYGLRYYEENNNWFDGNIEFEGRNYSAKFRAHGKQPDLHRHNSFISLQVKLTKNDKLFGEKKFNLIIYNRINYQRNFDEVALLAKFFQLKVKPVKPVEVIFNNNESKLYYFEQKSTSKTLGSLFDNSNVFFPKGIAPRSGIQQINSKKKAEEIVEEIKKKFPETDSVYLKKYLDFNRDINSNESALTKHFNLNYIANFEAFRRVGGFKSHSQLSHNLEMVLNMDDNKFYPIVHRDFYPGYLEKGDLDYSYLNVCRGFGKENELEILWLNALDRDSVLMKIVESKVDSFLLGGARPYSEKVCSLRNIHELRYYNRLINDMRNLHYINDPIVRNIEALNNH
jgi:hypothetical protein